MWGKHLNSWIIMAEKLNKYSQRVTQDPTQPAAQAMLHAMASLMMTFKKLLLALPVLATKATPAIYLNGLAAEIKKGIQRLNQVGLVFNTIGVSDGISMGTPGMRFSLPLGM